MSCNRGCERDFYNDHYRNDNRGLYDSLGYSPFDRTFGPYREPRRRRDRDKWDYDRWDRRYPSRYR